MAGTGTADILCGIRLIIFDFDGVIVDSEPLHHKKFAEVLAEEGITLSWDEYKAKYLAYNDRDCFEHVLWDRGWVGPKATGRSPPRSPRDGEGPEVRSFDETCLARLVARKAESFDRDMKTGVVPVPGTADFIQRAAPHYRLAIASGALHHEIEEILEWQGLRRFFPVIVGAEDSPKGKPNPDPFVRALELTNDLIARRDLAPSDLRPTAQKLTDSFGHPPHPEEGRSEVDRLQPVLPAECLVIEDSPLGIQGADAAGMRTLGLTTSFEPGKVSAATYVLTSLDCLEVPRNLPFAVTA